jgi:hypothetical protein
MAPNPSPVGPLTDNNRRRDLRLQILGQLYGHVVALDVPLAVRNLSAGGFAIESPVPFRAGASHQFRFTTDQDRSIIVSARAIHCMRYVAPNVEEQFLVGFEFLREPDAEAASEAIDALLETALSALTFH